MRPRHDMRPSSIMHACIHEQAHNRVHRLLSSMVHVLMSVHRKLPSVPTKKKHIFAGNESNSNGASPNDMTLQNEQRRAATIMQPTLLVYGYAGYGQLLRNHGASCDAKMHSRSASSGCPRVPRHRTCDQQPASDMRPRQEHANMSFAHQLSRLWTCDQ